MVFEHEIPEGCKLYFGKSLKLKREIENISLKVLEKYDFEEILTPNFSYHQNHNTKELIRFSDRDNGWVTLRADSTLEVVRIVTSRLGRSTDHKKWFYIQPIFKYPTKEQYQIGVEWLENSDITKLINIAIEIFKELEISPTLQISNINIAKKVCSMFNIENLSNLEELYNINEHWFKRLIEIEKISELSELIELVPFELKDDLSELLNVAKSINYKNLVISPLLNGNMKYYDSYTFKFFDKNSLIAMGGAYKDDFNSSGFAIYTDSLIDRILNKGF